MSNKVEERVLAFVRNHSEESKAAEVPLTEGVCGLEFGATPDEVREALFALAGRGLISLRKPQERFIPATPILTGKERAARFRDKMKAQGRKQLLLWVTPEEEAALRAALDEMRGASANRSK